MTELSEPIINSTHESGVSCPLVLIPEDNEDDRDVALITSDDTVIMLHKYELQFASPVFRDMLHAGSPLETDIGGRAVIRLVDNDFEDTYTVGQVVELLRAPESFIACGGRDDRTSLPRLWKFAAKYGMAIAKSVILSTIRYTISRLNDYPSPGYNPLPSLFTIAAAAKRTDLCEMILIACQNRDFEFEYDATKHAGHYWGTDDSDSPRNTAAPTTRTAALHGLDIAFFTVDLLHMIPSSYMIALARMRASKSVDQRCQKSFYDWLGTVTEGPPL